MRRKTGNSFPEWPTHVATVHILDTRPLQVLFVAKIKNYIFFLKKIESHFHIKRIYVPSIRESLMTIAKNWTKSFLFIYFSSVISKG